jgi:2-polyprenyl-3-methyl-5-hydroxy-6-metoxy-1,4-benzoquinol methylase
MLAMLQAEIARNYYRTTANRGHSPAGEHYQQSADGLLRRLRPWLPTDLGARCLDLGCGCGETLFMLERQGLCNTSGVDLCSDEIEQAREYTRGGLYCSDVLTFLSMTEPASVDFITALNFLEHLAKDQLFEVLREAARVLRPGGTLVAMVPNAQSPFGTLTRHWDITHEWAFVPNNFEQLASLAGFNPKVEFRECGPQPHGLKSGLRYLAWQGIRALIATYLLVEVASTKRGIYTMDMLVRFTA